MTRTALLALLGLPVAASAQTLEISPAMGAGVVTRQGSGVSSTSPSLGASAGVRLGSMVLELELSRFGTLDDEPEPSDLSVTHVGNPPIEHVTTVRHPSIFGTTALLLAARVPVGGGFFVRPTAGVAGHDFAVYTLGETSVESAGVSREGGIAAGLGVGRRFAGRVPFSVEASGLWSGGEDSTEARTVFAVRLVPHLSL